MSAFMNASSVTTLYGNLLPNALESAIASDEKQIELSATLNAEHTVVYKPIVVCSDIVGAGIGYTKFGTILASNASVIQMRKALISRKWK